MPESLVIETGVDRLVHLIKKIRKISIAEAAKKLGVSTIVVEEWADFLEDEGVISIEYKFTTPYLVERELTKTEVEIKKKDFGMKKEAFVRKAEVTLALIDKEAVSLQNLRGEFDGLKKDLGGELKRLKFDVKDLERYEELKNTIDERIAQQQKEFVAKMDEMHNVIAREEKRYSDLVGKINTEEKNIDFEKVSALSLRQKEISLREKLDSFRDMISKIDEELKKEDEMIVNSEDHTERLKKIADNIKESIEHRRETLNQIIDESKNKEEQIIQMQRDLLKKVSEKRKEIEDKIEKGKGASYAFARFFEKKSKIEKFLDGLTNQRDSLEKDLVNLIQMARTFTLTSKSKGIKAHVAKLKDTFGKIDKRKNIFEGQIRKLGKMLE